MDVIQAVSANLQECLGEDLDPLARDCRVVLRERAFSGRTPLLMVVATPLRKPDACWADFRLTAAQLGLDVSQTAVAKRFAAGQPLVDFFRPALERARRKAVAADPSAAALFLVGLCCSTGCWWRRRGRSPAGAWPGRRAPAEVVKEVLLALGDSAALAAALLRLRGVIEKLGGTTNRNKEPSHAQLIEDAALLDWLCP